MRSFFPSASFGSPLAITGHIGPTRATAGDSAIESAVRPTCALTVRAALMLAAMTGLLFFAPPCWAAEPLLAPERSIGAVVDHYLDEKLKAAGVSPAPAADEATVARRLYLDLVGRIPTASEARRYVAAKESDKRARLIDELAGSVGFAHHNANEFDRLLAYGNPGAPSLRPYLLAAFKEQRPWDRMFRELLGLGAAPEKPETFVLKRLGDQDALARDVSSVFFGLNITCAQCHQHPYIASLTQDYFFGMQAFFARSQDFQGNLIERQAALPATYKAKDGTTRPVIPMFLSGETVALPAVDAAEAKKAFDEESKRIAELAKEYAKNKTLPPPAELNLRQRLAELALSDANRDRFARSLVNRLFHRLYGRGLVMSLDQMHAENAASHPELLAWLSRDFIDHGYDLARLIRGLVSSDAYARSSRWDSVEPPAPGLFAVAAIRPLTREQWGVSHQVASDPTKITAHERLDHPHMEALVAAAKSYGTLIEQPYDDLQIGVNEALKLSNAPELAKSTGAKLAAMLAKLPDRSQQIDEAVWTVWSRAPSSDEAALLAAFLEQRSTPPTESLQQMLWALVNSPEFRFNH